MVEIGSGTLTAVSLFIGYDFIFRLESYSIVIVSNDRRAKFDNGTLLSDNNGTAGSDCVIFNGSAFDQYRTVCAYKCSMIGITNEN